MATFVSGPVGTSVTGSGWSSSSRRISSTACSPASGTVGSPNAGPSSPLTPWMSSAILSSSTSGRSHPAATGTPEMPAIVHTRRAFSVALSKVVLPATVVIASRSR
mgnify:CR=1 FL=1